MIYTSIASAPLFVEEWQVMPEVDPSHFREAVGPQYPTKCNRSPLDYPMSGRKKLQELREVDNGRYHRRASEACSHLDGSHHYDSCLFDVLVTGDEEWGTAPWYNV